MNYQLPEQKPHSGTEMLMFKQNMMLKEMSSSADHITQPSDIIH